MKAFTLAAVLVASAVSAQTINGVDASSVDQCVLTCATNAVTEANCQGLTDTACYCTSQTFLTSATSCITSQCPDQVTAALGFQQQVCSGDGASASASDAPAASSAAASDASASASEAASTAGSAAASGTDAAGGAAGSASSAAASGAATSGAATSGSAAGSGSAAASGSASATGNTTASGTTPSGSAAPTSGAVADFVGFKGLALAAVGAVAGTVFVL